MGSPGRRHGRRSIMAEGEVVEAGIAVKRANFGDGGLAGVLETQGVIDFGPAIGVVAAHLLHGAKGQARGNDRYLMVDVQLAAYSGADRGSFLTKDRLMDLWPVHAAA